MSEEFKILKPFLRGLPISIATIIISVWIAFKYLTYTTPIYESTTKIKLADMNEGIPHSNMYKNFDVFVSTYKIDAEIEVLKSSSLILKTARKLNYFSEIYRKGKIKKTELLKNSPIKLKLVNQFGSCYDKSFNLTLNNNFSYDVLDENNNFLIQNATLNDSIKFLDNILIVQLNDSLLRCKNNLNITGFYIFEFLSEEKLLDKIHKNLDVGAVEKDVPIIRLTFKSVTPEKCMEFVNVHAQTYIQDYIENKYLTATATVNFLKNQIQESRQKLQDSENEIEKYRTATNLINIHQETETDLRQISQMEIQLSNIKMNLIAVEQLYQYMLNGEENFLSLAPNFESFSDLLSTEIIKNIKKLQAEKKDLLLRYTDNEEKVKLVDEKIKDLSSYLMESVKNTKANLLIKYDNLKEDIEKAREIFKSVPEKEKYLTIMNRDFTILENSYNFLTEKKIEAEIAQSAKISFHRIITPAFLPKKPVSPNKTITLILSSFIGLFLSISIIYLVHFLKGRVNDIKTIESNSSIPIAVHTPHSISKNQELFSKIFTQLELKEIIKTGSITCFSSFSNKEGKEFNLINLIKFIQNINRTVVLIDIEGGVESKIDLNCIKTNLNDSKLKTLNYQIIKRTELSGKNLPETKKYLSTFSSLADYVFINNTNISEESESLLLMKAADINLVVIDTRETRIKSLHQLELLKHNFKIENLNFLINRIKYNPNLFKPLYKWIKLLYSKK